jgi:hypothetical protein
MGRRRRERARRVQKRRDTAPMPQTRVAEPLKQSMQGGSSRSWVPVTIAVALVVFAGIALIHYFRASATVTTPQQIAAGTPASDAPIIDGIPCSAEDITYHVHAFLEIYDRGQQIPVPANTGIVDNTCLYWLHTHDNSGEIHIEEPKQTRLSLGNFFDIWHQPLSKTQVATAHTSFSTSMRISVDKHPYYGNPRNIVFHPHELITIEVGPPWVSPSIFNFGSD